MQLWKKSYFFTFLIFQLLIFFGLLFFMMTTFKQQLKNEFVLFRQLINTSDFFVSNIEREGSSDLIYQLVRDDQDSLGFYTEVKKEEQAIVSTIPKEYVRNKELEQEKIHLIKERGKPFLVLKKI